MKSAYIIIRSWRRNNDNANRDIWGPARASHDEAIAAILEEVSYMFSQGDDPGVEGATEPAIVPDIENSNHNHGALRLQDGVDADTVNRIEIWNAATCGEGLEDMPEMSDWWERFDIEKVDLPDDEDIVIIENREFITRDIASVGRLVKQIGACNLKKPAVITCITRHSDKPELQQRFIVKRVFPGDNNIPLVVGQYTSDNDGCISELDTALMLTCHRNASVGVWQERTWDIAALLKALQF